MGERPFPFPTSVYAEDLAFSLTRFSGKVYLKRVYGQNILRKGIYARMHGQNILQKGVHARVDGQNIL
jgi:hypothetical protein